MKTKQLIGIVVTGLVIIAVVVRFPILISTLIIPDNLVVRDFIFEYSIADIVMYALGVMYFIILTYKTGVTIGKHRFRCRRLRRQRTM